MDHGWVDHGWMDGGCSRAGLGLGMGKWMRHKLPTGEGQWGGRNANVHCIAASQHHSSREDRTQLAIYDMQSR